MRATERVNEQRENSLHLFYSVLRHPFLSSYSLPWISFICGFLSVYADKFRIGFITYLLFIRTSLLH